MKMPIVILFKVKNKTIAYSPRYFSFVEVDFPLKQPLKLFYEDEINVVFGDNLESLNKKVEVEFNKKMDEFKPSRITNVYINTTNVCAGKCTYCYAENVMINTDIVNFDDFMETLETIDSVDTLKDVNLLGGEPLLNFDLIERILTETNYKVSISTGLFIKDKLFERFIDLVKPYGERVSVQCSIDPTNKYRLGSNGGQALYDRTERVLAELDNTQLRCTICTKDINYRKLRNDYERKLGKEILTIFEIVSKPSLWPIMDEWYELLSMLIMDAHEYLNGERTELPLSADEVGENILKQWNDGHSNFYITMGCSMYSGEAPVLTPDTIKHKKFQRCTQPQDLESVEKPFIMPNKCSTCEILRYCGVSCPAEATVPSFCATQLLKHLISMYVFLWRNEKWN